MSDDVHSLAHVAVDPDLFDLALHIFADLTDDELEEFTLLDIAGTAFVEWADTSQEAWNARDHATVRALEARLRALMRLIDAGAGPHLIEGHDEAARRAVAEAACFSELVEEEGAPAFRLTDFVARSKGAPMQ